MLVVHSIQRVVIRQRFSASLARAMGALEAVDIKRTDSGMGKAATSGLAVRLLPGREQG